MTDVTIGSLCSGYGGLDLAVENFFGARTAWFSEFEQAPSRVLAKHWPGVPNHGDMTKIDWAAVEPVTIVAAGTPCQDLSAAGKRRGMTEGTRSNLWVQMREAVAVIRPSLVVWENVRGAFSARADSEVESEPGLLGGYGPGRPALRALGRVLGDFSELGYDTEWVGIRAADAGAPHGRFRVFVLAYASGHGRSFRGQAHDVNGADAFRNESHGRDADAAYSGGEAVGLGAGLRASESGGFGRRRSDDNDLEDATDAERIGGERWGGHGDVAGASGTGEVDGEQWERDGYAADHRSTVDWGAYGPAIERWERTLGRLAPSPIEATGKDGARRLSPPFVEWMMGLKSGWVTDPAIGLSRNEQLKALGNGVVPQQAELALSLMWQRVVGEVAA